MSCVQHSIGLSSQGQVNEAPSGENEHKIEAFHAEEEKQICAARLSEVTDVHNDVDGAVSNVEWNDQPLIEKVQGRTKAKRNHKALRQRKHDRACS